LISGGAAQQTVTVDSPQAHQFSETYLQANIGENTLILAEGGLAGVCVWRLQVPSTPFFPRVVVRQGVWLLAVIPWLCCQFKLILNGSEEESDSSSEVHRTMW